MCEGRLYKIHFSANQPSGPIRGIRKATNEYLGQPSHLSLEFLLNSIHRCSSYIDTRIACSGVWAHQSKRYLLDFIECYLEKKYRPSIKLGWWRLYRMEKKLKTINVFAGIVRNLTVELTDVVSKIHCCMQKIRILLNKRLKEPEMPGFSPNSIRSSLSVANTSISTDDICNPTKRYFNEYCDNKLSASLEHLYEKLKSLRVYDDKHVPEQDTVSIQALLEIIAKVNKDIEMVCNLGKEYALKIRLPGKKGKRVLGYVNVALSQLGMANDIEFGALFATFLSGVDKLSVFEELMCEEKVEIRARIHKICLSIIGKLYDLRANLSIQLNWSTNLAKNSYMRIKEINEIRQIKQLKKEEKHINEKIEFLRGSDDSLRASLS